MTVAHIFFDLQNRRWKPVDDMTIDERHDMTASARFGFAAQGDHFCMKWSVAPPTIVSIATIRRLKWLWVMWAQRQRTHDKLVDVRHGMEFAISHMLAWAGDSDIQHSGDFQRAVKSNGGAVRDLWVKHGVERDFTAYKERGSIYVQRILLSSVRLTR